MVGVRPATLVGHLRTNHQSVMEHGVSDQPTSSDTLEPTTKVLWNMGVSTSPDTLLAPKAKAALRGGLVAFCMGSRPPTTRPFDRQIPEAGAPKPGRCPSVPQSSAVLGHNEVT